MAIALPTGFNIADIFPFVILGDSARIPTMSSFVDAVLSHKSPSFTSFIRFSLAQLSELVYS